MANDTVSDRLWSFTETAVIAAYGTPVIVRKVVYFPAAVDDDLVIQEYNSNGALRDAIVLKANHAAAEPLSLDFGVNGRWLNGFKLSTIDAGVAYVYIGRD